MAGRMLAMTLRALVSRVMFAKSNSTWNTATLLIDERHDSTKPATPTGQLQ